MVNRESERAKQLSSQGFMSTKELDDLGLRQRTAKLELEQARYDLEQTHLVAPFSGRVLERMINLGETVTSGKECFRVADDNPVIARLYFPQRELTRVRVGQEAVLTLDTQPGQEFPARVTLVNPAVDRANGTFKVTVELANSGGRLRLVLSEDGEDYVFVARGDSVVRTSIKLGALDGDRAQVLAGLQEGDRVVTVGQGGLKPGAKIKPVTL
jgi:multidrug efflux pump subunit AcrA (membrane-fusion protein)